LATLRCSGIKLTNAVAYLPNGERLIHFRLPDYKNPFQNLRHFRHRAESSLNSFANVLEDAEKQ